MPPPTSGHSGSNCRGWVGCGIEEIGRHGSVVKRIAFITVSFIQNSGEFFEVNNIYFSSSRSLKLRHLYRHHFVVCIFIYTVWKCYARPPPRTNLYIIYELHLDNKVYVHNNSMNIILFFAYNSKTNNNNGNNDDERSLFTLCSAYSFTI